MARILGRKLTPVLVILFLMFAVSVISVVGAQESSAPVVTAFSPGDGGTVNDARAVISFTVNDPDIISAVGYYIKVNGSPVTAGFEYKGHWESDQWDEWYVVDSYAEAAVTGTAAGLQDGLQTVEVGAKDNLGNTVVQTWTFNVAAKPAFSAMNPAAGSYTANNSSLSVKATDNSQVDPASIVLTVDGLPVQHSYDAVTGIVSFNTVPPLADGLHIINIDAADLAGNQAAASWSYTVQAGGPQLTFADAGNTFATAAPILNFGVQANVRLDSSGASMTVDGQPVNASFTYKGHWYYPFELDPEWIVDSYNEASVSGTPAGLKDGVHTVAVTAKDSLGNLTTSQWNFAVNAKPEFSSPSPTNGANTTDNRGFSIKVTDNDTIVPASIAVSLDGNQVPAAFDAATGIISSQLTTALADGSHKVDVSAADTTGNVTGFSWSFTVQTTGPGMTFPNEGQTFDTYNPTINVNIKSNVKILDTAAVMQIDGQPVAAALTYKGHWDYPFELDPIWVIDSYNEGTLTYTPASLSDGPHTLTVITKDIVNNTDTKTWTFAVAQKPQFSGMEPRNGTTVSTKTPTIRVTVTDPNGPAIDKASIKLLIDNKQVVPVLTDSNGAVAVEYVSGTLADDSYHDISFTAADTAGNPNTVAWRFYISSKTEMPAGAKACGSCHTTNQYDKYVHVNKGPFGFDKRNWSHMQGGNCGHCHGGYSDQFCGYCHNGDPNAFYEGTATPNPAMGAGQDCTFCHSPTPNVIGYSSSAAAVRNQVNNGILPLNLGSWNILVHDILPLHYIAKDGCNDCHSTYLTREHNRVSKQGVQLNCTTCHASTNPTVQQAVYAGNKDCSACHGQADHQAVHVSGIDGNCLSCHKEALTLEHLSNATTSGKNFNCDTCHASQAKEVKRAISANNLSCAGCHKSGHDVILADKVTADIPLYDGFRWTTPIEATVFTGESSAPAGYEAGQVVMSDRRTDIAVSQVWNYYNQQLTTGGWTVNTGAPAAGAVNIAAEFVKGNRALTLKYFNTETGNGTGQPQSGGYRIEIWYR